MPVHEDLALLIEAAREAGIVARRFFNQGPEAWDKPDGLGPVTEADMAVDRLLRHELTTARPGYGWLSEETEDDPARLAADRLFIVDPIDGTRAFIEGSLTWAHSLAVVERGEVTAAVVYLPMRDRMYAAARGEGASLNGKPLHASTRNEVDGATVLAVRSVLDPWNWKDAQAPGLKRNFRSSLAYRLSLVGEGRFDAMMTLRATWEWDAAAGSLIVTEAGGAVSDRLGEALVFNNPSPQVNGLVAGGREIHAALRGRMT